MLISGKQGIRQQIDIRGAVTGEIALISNGKRDEESWVLIQGVCGSPWALSEEKYKNKFTKENKLPGTHCLHGDVDFCSQMHAFIEAK